MCAGLGFDLIVVVARQESRPGILRFLEVKQKASIKRLTASERAAWKRYGNYWRVVTSLDEALEVLDEPA